MVNENTKQEQVKNVNNKTIKISFPRNSLNEAIRVPQVIWQENAGIPYPLIDIAKKLNHSPTSSTFRALIRSANRYGLISESFTQDIRKSMSLTPLGNSIVAPTPDENVGSLKRKALETPDLFKRVLSSLDGKILPPSDSLKNLLMRNFQLSKEDAEYCYNVLTKNFQELEITEEIQGKTYIRLDKLGNVRVSNSQEENGDDEDEAVSYSNSDTDSAKSRNSTLDKINTETPKLKVPKVFISHSKNKSIVTQIKEMLEFGEFEYEIAEERETLAIPISEKVFGLMEKCNCAIINISADEEKKQSDSSYAINENVLIEIGASYLHYKRRVILLIDNRLIGKLPSNIRELVSIRYEGDELSWNAGRQLQNALKEFRNQL
jgi:predicted nucleotide-binding protein